METSAILAIVISAAAFLTSVAGPCLTAHINSKHEQKMYTKRFKTEHKHEVIEKYLKAVGKYVFSSFDENTDIFGEASAEIFMYVPKELWDDIRALNTSIINFSQITGFEYKQTIKPQLQRSFLSLCEKFSDLNRTSENKHIGNRH